MYEFKYPAMKGLGKEATNANKKVMVRGWIHDYKVFVSLPNIFELEGLDFYPNETYEHLLFVNTI